MESRLIKSNANNEDDSAMPLPGISVDLTNWSLTQQSSCQVVKAHDSDDIVQALDSARAHGLSVIPHGAGHSYTDAALNTHGIVVDVTDMRRIISWDAQRGIMQVEPGVTVRDVVRVAQPDGWWPVVVPSTAEATIGGCVAMNVTGKNAWKCGPFGEHVLSLTMLTASCRTLAVSPESDPHLFKALIGSAGLLGIITSITLQLQPVATSCVDVRVRSAATLSEIVSIFHEEQSSDYLEALVDGFASGRQCGRGIVTSTRLRDSSHEKHRDEAISNMPNRLAMGFARYGGTICHPRVSSITHLVNRVVFEGCERQRKTIARHRSLYHSTFYALTAYALYRAILPEGIVSFQAFVPHNRATDLFTEILQRSQANRCIPLLCVVKQHRPDPFLLSYQVDGFSLEAFYQNVPQTAKMLHDLMDLVLSSGGRLYLAKDALLTPERYRQSVGDGAFEAFLALKRQYDPETLFQSDLFRRIFVNQAQGADRSLVQSGG